MSLEETPVTVSRGGEQRRPSPEDINPMAFRPYPPISHSDEL